MLRIAFAIVLNRAVEPVNGLIETAFAAAFAVAILCTCGSLAKAEAAAGDGQQQTAKGSHSHKQAKVVNQPQRVWGGPPLQDPRDAWQGYFGNPMDNPRYFGTGRATLIFR